MNIFSEQFKENLMTAIFEFNWRDASYSLPEKENIHMPYSKWCFVLTKKGDIKKSFLFLCKYWDDVQADDEVTHWIYADELPEGLL